MPQTGVESPGVQAAVKPGPEMDTYRLEKTASSYGEGSQSSVSQTNTTSEKPSTTTASSVRKPTGPPKLKAFPMPVSNRDADRGRRPVANNARAAATSTSAARAQMLAARYNSAAETNELRTLLKLPRDTPSTQVIHKLREAFHLMNIVERFRADLGRVLQAREARTAEGALRAVQELLMENEQLRQQLDRQQDIIAKLQEDRRAVLERFHRLVREHKIKDYGSGSLLALTAQSDSRFPSQETGLSRAAPPPGTADSAAAAPPKTAATDPSSLQSVHFGELTVPGTGEKRDLATLLSSRIDHLLVPKLSTTTKNAGGDNQQKELSPIYIRHKKNKDEKRMVYKITGVLRPASSAASSREGRPSTMPAAVPSADKLPEIVARRRTPTPTHRVKMMIDCDGARRPSSSVLSVTDIGDTATLTTVTQSGATTTAASSSRGSASFRPRRTVRGQPVKGPTLGEGNPNLVVMAKRYSSSALSAAGSGRQAMQPVMAAPPSSVHEQDESIGDLLGSISDVKKGKYKYRLVFLN